ncbi:transcription termination/antitermination factor NusG [Planctopirus limnophila DSM 3776]|uniref:Transcription termination/antitermination protein NusG n=1 Tax=Planctopirus limnophila (strain ATCC 43296 / DSM 3776 / IFAM 1008 / Mu 290) TaxID=521674 RepID=D5SPQ8_PLAL2|nr:transcription termination/antitermination protein NusG [Planctopirus limnophila]ADG66288.1 transcription termination/antitermination factor NusG [Planctopirus limnophila DSM 3776]
MAVDGKATEGVAGGASSSNSEVASTENAMLWYVLKITSNREKSIRDNLLRRIRQEGLEQFFGEILIPTEKVVENKNGKKKVVEHKLYPGYLMVQMILNDDTWYIVRTTGGVGDFTGSAGKPTPMQDHEIARMLQKQEQKQESAAPAMKIEFAVGDIVKIKEGTFEGFEGPIDSIDEANGKINVLVEIFGRSTPVELEYWQAERP